MPFRRRIETNRFPNFCNQIVDAYCWFRYVLSNERSELLNQQLIYFLNFPVKARADRTLTDFRPLCARRSRNIHIE
jgi:hypothetical protein